MKEKNVVHHEQRHRPGVIELPNKNLPGDIKDAMLADAESKIGSALEELMEARGELRQIEDKSVGAGKLLDNVVDIKSARVVKRKQEKTIGDQSMTADEAAALLADKNIRGVLKLAPKYRAVVVGGIALLNAACVTMDGGRLANDMVGAGIGLARESYNAQRSTGYGELQIQNQMKQSLNQAELNARQGKRGVELRDRQLARTNQGKFEQAEVYRDPEIMNERISRILQNQEYELNNMGAGQSSTEIKQRYSQAINGIKSEHLIQGRTNQNHFDSDEIARGVNAENSTDAVSTRYDQDKDIIGTRVENQAVDVNTRARIEQRRANDNFINRTANAATRAIQQSIGEMFRR